jgi:hypothetical protein
MTTVYCACGNPDGTNEECERCRLIAQLTAAETLIATMEAANDQQLRVQAELRARVEELRSQVAHADFIRQRFCAIVPGLTSRSWEDIWERVREMVRP